MLEVKLNAPIGNILGARDAGNLVFGELAYPGNSLEEAEVGGCGLAVRAVWQGSVVPVEGSLDTTILLAH